MSALIGTEAVPAVMNELMNCPEKDVFWRDGKHSVRSFVGLLQIYSDKSMTSLRASSLPFYPIHCTLLNFKEHTRRMFISTQQTMVGHLSVHLLPIDEEL